MQQYNEQQQQHDGVTMTTAHNGTTTPMDVERWREGVAMMTAHIGAATMPMMMVR